MTPFGQPLQSSNTVSISTMQFKVYADIDGLPDSANALFDRAAKESLFLSLPWFENLIDSGLEDAQSSCLACVVDRDHVLAILPLMRRSGTHLHALRHRYSSLFGLLITEQDHPSILTCLAEGLRDMKIDGLRLEPVAQMDPVIDHLALSMASAHFHSHRSFRFYNWVLKLEGQSFHEYMASRPSRLRNTVARKARKLAREHDYEMRLFTGPDATDGLADYHAVYGSSWKALEQYGDFLDGMVRAFSAHGWTRIAVLYIDEKPAAAQLWFVVQGKASIFRLAYDELWKQYSPGSILTAYLMEYVIDTDKVSEVDFLTGNEAYKQDWMSERRERWAISFANTHPKRSSGLLNRLKDVFRP